MPFIICVCLIMTGLLLFISFYQSIQIHSIKKELRKCMKTIVRCKPSLNNENRKKLDNHLKAIRQISKSLESMEAW
ncbi:MAG: DUF1552 domain-containing protein [Oscillospiraceae bacterium]|jgi:hypothetical protein|nr:DUF1552 domain-containing protein [Oscillospiraceae bacterium]